MTTIATQRAGSRYLLIDRSRWTPERIAVLRRMWPTHSAAQIAEKLDDGFTRMAVIGKAHRLNLPMKAPSYATHGGKRKTKRKL